MLGIPAHHLTLLGLFGCPWMVPKHSRGVNNLKNCEKLSENRNLIEMTHLLIVLSMPDHRPTLDVWFGCPQTGPKGSRTAGNSKNFEKWSQNRNRIGEAYFLRVLCMPAHHQTLPGSFGCPQTAPKVSRAAENSKFCEKCSENLILM